jgi:lipopolysaccharide biosynthesis glycosyltransferase
LGEYLLAAVEDFLMDNFQRLNLSSEVGYFNSGVMILQLDKWRELNLGDTVID